MPLCIQCICNILPLMPEEAMQEYTDDNENLHFLGKRLDANIAQSIAEGHMDPMTQVKLYNIVSILYS